MTLFTTDYLEYYLTLVSWIVNNGIWAVLVSSGVFALPFVAIIVQEWLKARAEGADEIGAHGRGDDDHRQEQRLCRAPAEKPARAQPGRVHGVPPGLPRCNRSRRSGTGSPS